MTDLHVLTSCFKNCWEIDISEFAFRVKKTNDLFATEREYKDFFFNFGLKISNVKSTWFIHDSPGVLSLTLKY